MTKPKQISKSVKLYEQLKELADKANGVRLSFEVFDNDITEDDNKTIDDFYTCFYQLQEQSIKDKFFWDYCPFQVYQTTFSDRIGEFLNKAFFDAELNDFIWLEISKICVLTEWDKQYRREKFWTSTDKDYFLRSLSNNIETNRVSPAGTNYYVPFYLKPEIEASQRKKITFLLEQANSQDKSKNDTLSNESGIDYSDNTLAEKITFIYELGILDFLREKQPFNTSTNKLASIVSSFTGEKQTSIQPALNAIFGKRVVQKNNPITADNQQKVRKKLIEIGYEVTKEK